MFALLALALAVRLHVVLGLNAGCQDSWWLSTQADVQQLLDADCSVIGGYLWVNGGDVEDLSGLVDLRQINKSLSVWEATSLKTLRGLEGLTALGKDDDGDSLYLSDSLQDISALAGVQGGLPGRIVVQNCPALQSLHGLEGIASVGANHDGSSLLLHSNEALHDVSALAGVSGDLPGSLKVQECPALQSLHGLEGITFVGAENDGSSLYLLSNTALHDVSALAGVSGDLPGSLKVQECPALQSVHGLEGITSVGAETDGASLVFAVNIALHDISALAGIQGGLPGSISVIDCPALQSLHGLEGITSMGSLFLFSNIALHDISALAGVQGALPRSIAVRECPALRSLHGLERITALGGGIILTANTGLRDISALGRINGEVPGGIQIEDCTSLQFVHGLDGVASVSRLLINGNSKLESLAGFSGMLNITGDGDTAGLHISGNEMLSSLHGLDRLTNVGGKIEISDNNGLLSLAALRNVRGDVAGHVYIKRNYALKSLQGLQGFSVDLEKHWMPSIELPEHACFPEDDRRPSQETSQPNTQWNESLCHVCSPSCSNAACDYGSGRCRCPLGMVGPVCATPAPRLRVEEGQVITCDSKAVDCEARVRVCLESTMGFASITAISLYDACSGSATSSACSSARVSFDLWSSKNAVIVWDNRTCGSLVTSISIYSGPFEPEKAAVLHVGYRQRLYPDVVLDGTIMTPPHSAAPPVYPWCISSGDCVRDSPVLVNLSIRGRDRRCEAGEFARRGVDQCYKCPDGTVARRGHLVDHDEGADVACERCSWLIKNAEGNYCVLPSLQVLVLLALGFSLLFAALTILGTQLQLLWTSCPVPTLAARLLIVENVSVDHGRVLLTTNMYHGLRSSRRNLSSSFPLTLEGTGHRNLDGLGKVCSLRARVFGLKQLELLDKDGKPLPGLGYESSMGQARLSFWRTLLHTGWPLPLAFLIPMLVAAGLASLAVAHAWQRSPGSALTAFLAVVVAAVVDAVPRMSKRSRMMTPMEIRLKAYQASLAEKNPDPRPCERGAGRAIRAGQLLDLMSFFRGFLEERNMYYLVPNIVMPLTKKLSLSFAELVGPSQINWFVSHYWGHPFVDTCTAIKKHAQSKLAGQVGRWGDLAYWVCTFSNNQYEVADELGHGHWEESSFYLSLRSPTCKGTCLILDERVSPLSRSWCLFEFLQTIDREESDSAFQGLIFCTSSGILRELGSAGMDVALNIGKTMVNLHLKDAKASCASDKEMIDALVVASSGSFEAIDSKLRSHIKTALSVCHAAASEEFEGVRSALSGDEHPVGQSFDGSFPI